MKSISAANMAEVDRIAQEEYGIGQDVLMRNAGDSVAEGIVEDTAGLKEEKIIVLCGKGNNGGDGFVIAKHLYDNDPAKLTVYVSDAEGVKEGAALDNFMDIKRMGLDIRPVDEGMKDHSLIDNCSIFVDALFGTGFKGELSEDYIVLGEKVNSLKNTAVYAVDIPSGLNATTGDASRGCFRAKKTVTFGLAKHGFFIGDGPEVCGEIIVKDIGFPEELLERYSD